MFSVRNRFNLPLFVDEPFPTNVGGDSGQKVVTTTFTLSRYGSWHHRVFLSADLDRLQFQDAFEMRRRSAMAVVGLARRASIAITRGELLPEVTRKTVSGSPLPWATIRYVARERFEGFERVAHAYVDFRSEPIDQPPHPAAAHSEWISSTFQRMGDALHSAIDLDENRATFWPASFEPRRRLG